MRTNLAGLLQTLKWAVPGLLLVVVVGCARLPPTSAVAIAPIPPGQARIWVYRAYEPYSGKGLPAVFANGRYIGQAELGGAFYRDVPPGQYQVTVESYGVDFNQVANFAVAPGQQAYVKIVSLPSWVESGSRTVFQRPTFYAWLIRPEVAARDVSQLSFYGGA